MIIKNGQTGIDFTFRCSDCGREFPLSPDKMLCDSCSEDNTAGEPLKGILEVQLNVKEGIIDKTFNPLDLLPLEAGARPLIPVGNTPLWKARRLNGLFGTSGLALKNDAANPTGSLKDRASYLVAGTALNSGIREIALASTGNAGSSMAGIGAASGIKVHLFLPAKAPEAKRIQAKMYGAELHTVNGSYDDAYDASLAFSQERKCLSRNTAYNPFTIEGKKTAALEIFLQYGIPDYVFVPTGDGVILSGVYKGFEDIKALGLSDSMPCIVAVQAEGSNAIHRCLEKGAFGPPVPSDTCADSIAVDIPRGGTLAVRKLKKHGGTSVCVSDVAILDAQKLLAAYEGVFAEPAAAASLAGFIAMKSELPADAKTVLLITGSGLKDIESAKKALERP